jgi:hypothetical protein
MKTKISSKKNLKKSKMIISKLEKQGKEIEIKSKSAIIDILSKPNCKLLDWSLERDVEHKFNCNGWLMPKLTGKLTIKLELFIPPEDK